MGRFHRIATVFSILLLAPVWASADTISPTEASRHIGEIATVEGQVSQVHIDARSGVTFLNMGGRYPSNAFTGVIFSDYAGQFPGVGSLEGQVVRITGKLKLYKGKPEIILRKGSQISRP